MESMRLAQQAKEQSDDALDDVEEMEGELEGLQIRLARCLHHRGRRGWPVAKEFDLRDHGGNDETPSSNHDNLLKSWFKH